MLSPEVIAAIGSIASALILAIATIAAIVQLRHLRWATQLQGFLALFDRFNSPEMIEARNFCLAQDFTDPSAVAALMEGGIDRRVLMAGNYFHELGSLIRTGVLDRDLFAPIFYNAPQMWEKLAPVAEAISKVRGGGPVWLDMQYAAWLARQEPFTDAVRRLYPQAFLHAAGRPGISS
ncbi:MAG: hypothetical protein JO060_07465 [Candidatus Eremiobacteraeota bacterium]|nr:hypothetical protein [Candidatus Eremiobacteraeota bacterium]